MSRCLKGGTTRAVFWSGIERFSTQGVSFILGIILARLLCPSEFGLIAMLTIFLDIAQTFVDSGFANALIQKQNRTEIDFSTVFYFNIVVAIIVYTILYILSPHIASFYNQPLLCSVMRCIGLNIILSSFLVIQKTKFVIDLNFKVQAKISFISILVSGIIGIYLAYNGCGVWALVFQSISNNVFLLILFWFVSKWKPILCYSWESFRELFSFGSKLLLSSLLHSIYTNLYSLIIGKFYTAADLGYYNRMSSMGLFPTTNIMQVLIRVIYPIQCQLQNNKNLLESSFIQYLRIACFIIFPIMIGISVLAEPIVSLILTDKWLSAVPLLQILCLGYMWTPVMMINNNILSVMGRTDYFFKAELLKKAIAFLILIFTLSYGLYVLCWGVVFYYIVDVIVIIFFSKKVIRTGYVKQLKNILPIFINSVLVGLFVYCGTLYFSSNLLKLLLGSIMGILLYIAFSYLFKIGEMKMIVSIFIRNKTASC